MLIFLPIVTFAIRVLGMASRESNHMTIFKCPRQGGGASPKVRRQTAAFIGESVRPVRRYFSKEAKSRLIREGRAVDQNEGDSSSSAPGVLRRALLTGADMLYDNEVCVGQFFAVRAVVGVSELGWRTRAASCDS